ncbi:MAG: HAMP domain-containing histidine kinase [Cyanobacteria bacterium SIG26]|nr:HAMP domain-containing histidine kinase [Cyanobacteria bacterium SIG26]
MNTEISKEIMTQQIRCVSHEIRNHLSICDMYSQIIRKNLEKEGFSNISINNAIDCIQKSIQIIGTNLLDLRSLNNSTEQNIDFARTLNKGIELSKAYIIDKNIEINSFVKNSANLKIDENKFLACIVNIVKNGIEAIEIRGKIEILAEIKDNFAIIKISNDGKPIPKDKQNTIFNSGYTTKKTGCGLGLAICKKYFDSIGAEIKLTKSTKTQTQFEIRIPTIMS